MTKARYTAIYRLHGANSLPDNKGRVILALETPKVTATLTSDPDPYFIDIDKSLALRTVTLRAVFQSENTGTVPERVRNEIEVIRERRKAKVTPGVWLALEGETDVSIPDLKSRRDMEEFALSLSVIPASEVRNLFRPFAQSTITAVSLNIGSTATSGAEKFGDVVFLVDEDTQKPVYDVDFDMSIRGSVAKSLTEAELTGAARTASRIAGDRDTARLVSLLATSLDWGANSLQAFVAAWSALEIFINASFRAKYQRLFFEVMENGAPHSSKPVFERLRDVMSDKYRLADKFLIVASVLDAETATADADEFKRLKKIRDDLFHTLDSPSQLPTEAIQSLLLKYFKLHLLI